jgi:predicted metal-dependent phosphoesterase TrpH
MPRFDLHVHSTFSDGLFTPAQLAVMARQAGLAGLALTDHDTVEGVEAMQEAGAREGLRIIPGVEISADFEPGTLHMVGLGVDIHHPGLCERLAFLQRARAERNPRIASQLRAAGLDISWEEVRAESQGGQVGRPHFAAVLIRKGHATGIDDAFERWLGKGQPGYVEKDKLSPEESVSMIRQAGGLAALAHPVQLGISGPELEALVARLKLAGLQAIEAFHSDHGPAEEAQYQALAARHGLLISGGSDFHGFADKPVRLGQPSLDEAGLKALLGAC